MNISSTLFNASRTFPRSKINGWFARTGLAAACSLALSVSAFAEDQSFSDDFESYWEWASLRAPWNTTTLGGSIYVVLDQNDLFGQGTSNLIVDYSKQTPGDASYSNVMLLENAFSMEVGRMSFDFVRPADGTDDNMWIILQAGNRSTGNRAQVLTVGEDAINGAEYNRGELNHVELVFNNSNQSILYGDENALEAGTVDIWINGELKRAGFVSQNNKRGPVTTFEFNSAGSRIHQFYFDNIAFEPVEWNEVPPEPPQIILHEDFSSHTAGALPGEPWTEVTDDPEITGSAFIQKDTADLFGKGVDNHYMEYIANGDGAIVARSENAFSSDLITFSVRLLTPHLDDDYSWFIFNVGNVSGSTNRAQVITLDNRVTDTSNPGYSRIAAREYPQNVPVQIDLIMNNRPVPVEYGDGQIVESGTTDVWIDGVLARSGYSSQNNKLGAISTFELNVSGSRQQHLLIDEITIFNYAVVTGVPTEGGFADWRQTHFPDDADNDEISGPEANPTGDGISNLIKYALGLDPKTASREGLPTSETQEIDGTEYLTLTFQRPSDRDDASLTVVATGDLSVWETEAVLVETIDNGDGSITEIWRDVEPIEEAGARFLRLEVSLD